MLPILYMIHFTTNLYLFRQLNIILPLILQQWNIFELCLIINEKQ